MRRGTARLARACATTVPLRRGKAAERGPCAQHGVALACDAESIGGRACVVIGGGGRGDGADRYVSAHSSRTPWGPNGLPPRRCECQGHACNTVAMSVRCVPSVSSPLVRVRRRQPEPPCAIAHRCVPSVQMGDGNRRSGRGPSVRRAIQAVWRGRAARQWRAGGRKARLDFPLEHHALQLLCDTRSEARHECDGRTDATRTRVHRYLRLPSARQLGDWQSREADPHRLPSAESARSRSVPHGHIGTKRAGQRARSGLALKHVAPFAAVLL